MLVKTKEIEEFIMERVLVYIDCLKEEQTIQFLLLEKDLEDRDSLTLASELEFYTFLEHKSI